jgi:hypothetical protein
MLGFEGTAMASWGVDESAYLYTNRGGHVASVSRNQSSRPSMEHGMSASHMGPAPVEEEEARRAHDRFA